MSHILVEHHRIAQIMDKFTHEIAMDVGFEYLKPYLHQIFTRPTLQRAEGRDRGNYDIMGKICDSARTLSMTNFLKFLDAIKEVSRHVYDHINMDYNEMTGSNLPNHENAPVSPQNAPISPQNASVPPQNASVPPQNAYVPPQNAFPISQNAESLEPNTTTTESMEICNPEEMPTPGEFYSSHSVSTLHAEVTEPNMVSGNINYVSLGAAVPCPSDQLPPPGSPVSTGNAAQLPCDFLEGNQTPGGSSTLEVSSTNPNTPLEAKGHHREQSSELRKYYKIILKEPDKVYKMDSFPRGHCLIINNEKFDNLSYRNGSTKDLNRLEGMFQFLGFEVLPYQNKTAREMTALLEEFSRSPALGQISSVAVVILSHGGPHESIYGRDGAIAEKSPVAGTFITRLELQHIFNGTNCPSMIGKPKLFILQACRGDMEDDRERSRLEADEDQQGSSYSRDDDASMGQAKGPETESDNASQDVLHTAETADMCFVHSSSLGYKSYRSKYKGSPFIEIFTEEVENRAHSQSFRDIVMSIQNRLSTILIGHTKMTMPEHFTLLRRKWYFNPPDGES